MGDTPFDSDGVLALIRASMSPEQFSQYLESKDANYAIEHPELLSPRAGPPALDGFIHQP